MRIVTLRTVPFLEYAGQGLSTAWLVMLNHQDGKFQNLYWGLSRKQRRGIRKAWLEGKRIYFDIDEPVLTATWTEHSTWTWHTPRNLKPLQDRGSKRPAEIPQNTDGFRKVTINGKKKLCFAIS